MLDTSIVCFSRNVFWKPLPLCHLPNNKILDLSKFKAFADIKINVTDKLNFVMGSVENIMGKEENSGNQHFLLFPHCFHRLPFQGREKFGLCGKGLKTALFGIGVNLWVFSS